MAIKVEKQLIPAEHAERVILTDSFGKKHEFKVYLMTADNPDAAIQAHIAIMEQEEKMFAARAKARGHNHPAINGLSEDCGCR